MIILHLSALDKVSTQEYEWELTPAELGEGGNESLFIKAVFEVNAMKNRQYDFKGKLCYGLKLKCDRCLEIFSRSFEENVHFILKKDYEGNELDIIRFNDLACNVTDYIRDIILTSVPMKNLCSEKCRGLCEKCGKNLNKGACGCKKQEE
ncbi:MAG: DUF177 domain-containing protein [bacterium]|nr:DUF177 domain-containing protein [bacterium]